MILKIQHIFSIAVFFALVLSFFPNSVLGAEGKGLDRYKITPEKYQSTKISWAKSFDEAISRGLSEGKPVYVSLSARKFGNPKAERFCGGYEFLHHTYYFQSAFVKFLNTKTIPVRIDLADNGFPKGIPALKRYEEMIFKSPWARFGYGIWFMLDPQGKYV